MSDPKHERHKSPTPLVQPRELVVACAAMQSHVNLSRIARAAACCGVRTMLCCGTAKLVGKIARDAVDTLDFEVHRTLGPPLGLLKEAGFRLAGLEQTDRSQLLYDYRFERRSVLVVGNERTGFPPELLRSLDDVVEIPVYGLPYSHNVATAAAMGLYEYCRQFPEG